MPDRRRWLPRRSRAEVLEAFPHLRQSLLADFDNCRLMTRFTLEGAEHTNAAQARGILFHRYAAEVLRTLHRTGEATMPVGEALAILYETLAQRDVPDEDVVLPPARERRLLRIAAIKLVHENEFRMERLIDVERRLFATVAYPHPETGERVERAVTGRPDALLADPPDGAVVLDWKTTPSPPPPLPERRAAAEGESTDSPGNLSYLGYFQQRVYALLVMANYPAVQRVTLREFYVLAGVAREATVARADLEHVEDELAALAELADRALAGGHDSKVWAPSPGRHCAYCPRPGACPIEREARGDGAVSSPEVARRYAAEYVVADRVRSHRRDALKAWVELTGHAVPVRSAKGRYELRWGSDAGGRRRFSLHVPEASDRGPADPALEEAFSEAAARRRSAA